MTKMCLASSILFEKKSELFLTLLVHLMYLLDLPSPINRGQDGITKKKGCFYLHELEVSRVGKNLTKHSSKTLRLISKEVIEEDKK